MRMAPWSDLLFFSWCFHITWCNRLFIFSAWSDCYRHFSGAANGVIVMPSISAVIATVRSRVMSCVFFLLCRTTFLFCRLIRSVGGSSISGGCCCSMCVLLWLEFPSVGRQQKCFHNSHNRRFVKDIYSACDSASVCWGRMFLICCVECRWSFRNFLLSMTCFLIIEFPILTCF